jgi:hypothetical protein
MVDFFDVLYGSEAFIYAITNALTDDGIFITQTGMADEPDNHPDNLDPTGSIDQKNTNTLQQNGAVSTKSY